MFNIRNKRVLILILLAAGAALIAFVVLAKLAYAPTHTPAPVQEESIGLSAAEPLPSSLEVVDTAEARMVGLSGRTEVPDDYGMLFVFETAERQGFWMKDMQVSIDILWLSREGTVLAIKESVSPDTYPEVFEPAVEAQYALETRAGYAKSRGWKVGTRLDLSAYAK